MAKSETISQREYKKEVLIEHFKELLQGMVEGDEFKTFGTFVDMDFDTKTAFKGTIRLEIEITDISDIF